MRVAAAQFKAEKGSRDASFSALRALVEPFLEGVDLLVLPEMALTGYCFPSVEDYRRLAEPADGPTFEALASVAAAHRTWVVCGYPELAPGGQLFNSALVIDATGTLRFSYRKTLLFEADEAWAEPGDSGYRVFDTGAGRFTVGICMDLNDDRFCRWVRTQAPEVVAFPTNWIHEEGVGIDIWDYWRLRLLGSRAALVAANTYGADGPYVCAGRSAVLRGSQRLASAPSEGNLVLVAEVRGAYR